MILVTTPTGNIGSHVLRNLLDSDERLRVILRDPARLPPEAQSRVEVVQGSHEDAGAIDAAMRGVDAVFWLCPPTPRATPEAATTGFTRAGAEAIRRHRVGHVVAATTLGRGTKWQDRAGMATASIRMIDLLRETGAAVRGLALPAFMDNARLQVNAIRAGTMQGAVSPDRKLPHVATRDAGAVGAGLLSDRSWTGQADIPVLGPEEHSYADIARIIGEETGRMIRYEQVPFKELAQQMIGVGWPEPFADAYVAMLRAKDEGMDNAVPRSSAILGPTTFRRWVAEELRLDP